MAISKQQELVFDYIPEFGELEELLEQTPHVRVNLANVLPCHDLEHVELLESYACHINGIHVVIDCGDDLEMNPLWAYSKINFLRLSFTGGIRWIEDLDVFSRWLSDLPDLEAVHIGNRDLISDDVLEALYHWLPTPVVLIVQKRRKKGGKTLAKRAQSDISIPNIEGVQVFEVKEAILSYEALSELIGQGVETGEV